MLSFETVMVGTPTDELLEMMAGLYAEDPSDQTPDPAQFRATVLHLVSHPEQGQIVLFRSEGEVSGYALLIPYWSNEFGGRVIFVDELFVREQRRSRGIATAFMAHLRATPPWPCVALALEVTPGNARARRLYEALGFVARKNALLVSTLE